MAIPQAVKPGFIKGAGLPLTLLAVVFTVAALNLGGFITLPSLGGGLVFETHDATLGKPFALDFSDALIPLLDPQGGNGPYTFYLGSGVGFPPMGLILGIDGVLRGTPTGNGGTFQVCVKDVGGRSICRKYHMDVNSASSNTQPTNPPSKKCPATSCDTGSCCGAGEYDQTLGVNTRTSGVLTYDYCECPSDTIYSGTTDRVSPGGPYKICNCGRG